MMYRNILTQLEAWRTKPGRKPLVLSGARQVGKTYILRHFGKKAFRNVAYINCDDNVMAQQLFAADYDIQRIVLAIGAITGERIVAGETLIILDEIQEAPRGISALKYFCEKAPQYHVAVAGSLLGLAMHRGESFPVGKVDHLTICPMSFDEFLLAQGRDQMVDLLRRRDWETIKLLREEYIKALRAYYFVGGMPEAVSTFVDLHDTVSVREVQRNILYAYRQDMAKHVTKVEANRIHMVWESMPSQLVKENKKFIYGVARPGARAKDFETAIQWLIDAGLVYKACRFERPLMPLSYYADRSAFKLFLLDCGLLGALSDTPPERLLVADNGMEEAKGAFTENFLMSQLVASGLTTIGYYANDARLEIDFLVQHAGNVIPIEAKAEENLRAKSLTTLLSKYPALHGLRFSMSDYREETRLTNVPLYAAATYFTT